MSPSMMWVPILPRRMGGGSKMYPSREGPSVAGRVPITRRSRSGDSVTAPGVGPPCGSPGFAWGVVLLPFPGGTHPKDGGGPLALKEGPARLEQEGPRGYR